MPLLPRKGILAIAAVIDIALQRARAAGCRQSACGTVIACHRVIWSQCCRRWCAQGILKGVRGPRGGYELAREQRRITADDILRAAGTVEEADDSRSTARR